MKKIQIILAMFFSTFLLCSCHSSAVYVDSLQGEVDNKAVCITEEEKADTKGIQESDIIGTETDTVREAAVYVCGAVCVPGVYYMPEGSIKQLALDMAGGLLEEAATTYVNLAEEVHDGEKIYFPYEHEVVDYNPLSPENSSKATGVTDSYDAVNAKVNINTADEEQLMTLQGIGKSKAQAVITYRNEQGTFAGIEDIQKVSGIGESTYNNIKDSITVN